MTDELNVINKTLSSQLELDCTLRDSCNILDPSIFIRKTNADGGSAIPSYNYAYIPEFNRYYFITDITSVNNQLWRIDMHVDVLMSYKDNILAQEVYVLRNENEYNEFLPDSECVADYSTEMTYGFGMVSGNPFFNAPYVTNPRLFAVSIYDGSEPSQKSPPDRSDITPQTIFPNIDGFISPYGITNYVYAFSYNELQELFHKIASLNVTSYLFNSENGDYIISVRMYPFDISQGSTIMHDVWIAGEDIQLDAVLLRGDPLLANKGLSKLLIESFDMSLRVEDFRELEPYCNTYLYLPYYGFIDLDLSNFINKRYLYIYLTVDFSTGKAQYALAATNYNPNNPDDNPNLWAAEFTTFQYIDFSLGVDVPVSFARVNEMLRNATLDLISLGVGMRGASLRGNLAQEQATKKINKGGTYPKRAQRIGEATEAVGRNDAVSSAIGGINSITLRPSIAQGNSSGYGNWVNSTRPYILKIKHSTNNPEDYAAMRGRPLMEIKTLSTLTGLTICGDVHLQNIGTATSTEINEIEDILMSSIIIKPES